MTIIGKKTCSYLTLSIFFLLICFNTSARSAGTKMQTDQFDSEAMASIAGRAIYHLDQEQLLDVMKGYLKEHDAIKGMIITDSISGESLLTYFRRSDKAVYAETIPDEILALDHLTEKVVYRDELVGTIEIYYQLSEKRILADQEEEWLRSHPVIRLATIKNRKPFDITAADKPYAGMHADLLKIINQTLGSNFQPIFYDTWESAYTAAEKGRVEGILGLSWTESREKTFFFSPSYHYMPVDLITRSDHPPISSWAAIGESMIWAKKNSPLVSMIEKELPDTQVLKTHSEISALSQVSIGVGDAYLSWVTATDTELSRMGLRKALKIDSRHGEFSIGIHKSQPVVASILEKGLNAIPLQTFADIRRRWSGDPDNSLTVQEERWLELHPITRVAVINDWPPYDMTDDKGIHIGLHADIIAEINQNMGTQLVLIVFKNWEDAYNEAVSGSVDTILGLSWSREREEIFNYSKPYRFVPHQLVTRTDESGIINLDDLDGKELWVISGTIYEKSIPEKYPKIILKTAKDTPTMFQKLLSGMGDAYLDEDIARQAIPEGLKVSPDIYLDEGHLHFGSHKSRPLLASIINKGLNSIPRKRMAEIKNHWFNPLLGDAEIDLTGDEQNWLNSNRKWRVANEVDWPPFDFAVNGKPQGFSIDIIKLAAKKIGVELEFVNGYTWAQLMEQFKEGKLDILPALFKTKERQNFIAFTHNYAANPSVMVVQSDDKTVKNLADMQGKSVAVIKGYANAKVLAKNHPGVKQVLVKDISDGLKAVSVGNADSFIGSLGPISYVLEKEFIPNINIVGDSGLFEPHESYIYMGVAKGREIFRDILQKGIDSITVDEYLKIRKKWMPFVGDNSADKSLIDLTQGELRWLAEHGNFTLGMDPSWPPFEFIDKKGAYSGISAGYVELVSSRLDITMNPIPDLSRMEVITKAKAGEVDILPAVARTPEREKYLLFTSPYVSFPNVIATRKDAPFVNSLKGLEGKKVGVVQGYAIHELLADKHKELDISVVKNINEGLLEVQKGRLDAFVDNLAAITHEIDRSNLTDIKIAAPTPYQMALAMAVRKSLPELVPLLEKALNSVNEREKASIINSWIAVKIKYGLDMKTVLLWVVPLTLAGAAIILLVMMWNLKMAKEINRRKIAQKNLRESENRLNLALKGGDLGSWDVNLKTGETLVNDRWAEMLGFQPDELNISFETWKNTIHVKDRELVLNTGLDYREGRIDDYEVIYRAVTKQGKIIWQVSKGGIVEWDEDGSPVRMVGTVMDITKRITTERALKKNEAKYRELVENANSIIIKLNPEGRITFFNEYAQKFFGFSSEEILGKDINDSIVPKKDSEGQDMSGLIQDIILHPEKFEKNINENICKNGKRVWINWTNKAVFDDNQEFSELLCIGGDITERRQAEIERDHAFSVITSSIDYASRIQRAILPPVDLLKEATREFVIIWEPRDVVGGDIYWCHKWGKGMVIILTDCTGHGVPGAFMTLISSGALESAIFELPEGDPAGLISKMHQLIQIMLGQDRRESEADDGLELGACYIPPDKKKVIFSGAGFPLFISENSKIKMTKGDRKGIGYRKIPLDTTWTNTVITVEQGMRFYMSTDGFFDQIGGPKRRGFGKKRFIKLLDSIQALPFTEQGDAIYQHLVEYQGKEKRRDDISMIGFSM